MVTKRGGLSGAPVRDKSTHTVKVLAEELAGRMPIFIAAGGSPRASTQLRKSPGVLAWFKTLFGLYLQGTGLDLRVGRCHFRVGL